ncbi:shikimate kinase [Klebsormidium nitens]|uniref:shikimate kinase n=1 Tax=Klebsormidium nitens TaxID=105231 RepID=A0A1Y1I1K6_KLENI|nr:shikimate kinase [Klebsormidium nitens]|eukprot:GAQ82646.1 shikimate kinase [Klebsormidium nitens]
MALVAQAPAFQRSFLEALPAANWSHQTGTTRTHCWHNCQRQKESGQQLELRLLQSAQRLPAACARFKRRESRKKDVQCSATPRRDSLEPESERRVQEKAVGVAKALGGVNVYLVGMMGSGKSTIGKLLAERLQYRFFDCDEVIEGAVGAPVSQIFKENGEDTFRKLETEVLSQLARETRSVISTGGGAVLRKENWSSMHYGISIFLQVPIQTLAKRVTKNGHASRPLLNGGDATDESAETKAFTRLSTIWKDRKAFYENADVTVSIAGYEEGEEEMSTASLVEKVVHELETLLKERGVKKPQDSTGWVTEL